MRRPPRREGNASGTHRMGPPPEWGDASGTRRMRRYPMGRPPRNEGYNPDMNQIADD